MSKVRQSPPVDLQRTHQGDSQSNIFETERLTPSKTNLSYGGSKRLTSKCFPSLFESLREFQLVASLPKSFIEYTWGSNSLVGVILVNQRQVDEYAFIGFHQTRSSDNAGFYLDGWKNKENINDLTAISCGTSSNFLQKPGKMTPLSLRFHYRNPIFYQMTKKV